MGKLRALVVGATGVAGQQFVAALENHPWIELTGMAASSRSAGKTYTEALKGAAGQSGWSIAERLPAFAARMTLTDAAATSPEPYDLIFSAVEADVAQELEPRFAKHRPVISAASAFRYAEDVPLLIPPVNAGHSQVIPEQRRARGFKGFIAPIPNCTTTGLAITLAPLKEAFGVQAVVMTSLQAMSGAGRSPGVIGLDILDNVIPFIPKEEEKVDKETRKILGPMRVSCTCTRVAVLEGHTESVFVSLAKRASPGEVAQAMASWKGAEIARGLPSSPPRWIEVLDDPFRPQPRLDRDTHGGMATTVGRVREDGVWENGIKYVLVSHNTKMGAARGAILVAELLKQQGFLG